MKFNSAVSTHLPGAVPGNRKFARALKEPSFEARAVVAEKDAAALTRDILATSEEEFRTAFAGSAMQGAKTAGPKRHTMKIRANFGLGLVESRAHPRHTHDAARTSVIADG